MCETKDFQTLDDKWHKTANHRDKGNNTHPRTQYRETRSLSVVTELR